MKFFDIICTEDDILAEVESINTGLFTVADNGRPFECVSSLRADEMLLGYRCENCGEQFKTYEEIKEHI